MICSIVLAAGRSARMGTQKLLLPLGGKPVIARIVDELLNSGLQQVIVVVGKDAERIQQALDTKVVGTVRCAVPARAERGESTVKNSTPGDGRSAPGTAQGRRSAPSLPDLQLALATSRVTFVPNPDPEGDMLSSIRCGLRAAPPACEAVLVTLGDQPGITHQLVADILSAFRNTGRGIIVPTHRGRHGHPLLFAARFRDEVLTEYEGVGLRGLLKSHPQDIFELPVSNPAMLEDMDTPEDYQRNLRAT